MAPPKSIDRKNALRGTIPEWTPWTFVRAAGAANRIVANEFP